MKKEDRKEQILNSTLKIIERKPLDAIRTAEIALEAGISEGALFKYFSSRDDIFNHIMERFDKNSQINCTITNIDSVNELGDFIDEYLTNLISSTPKHIAYIRLLIQISMNHHPLSQRKYINAIEEFWNVVEEKIEYGKINWSLNLSFDTPTQIRLLHFSILMFLIEQEVFNAKEIEEFNITEVKNLAINNFLTLLKTKTGE
ncbi:MAG: TetR/AcrR family transcriptional regulator [Candidatus Marinimicrobia bacterium]|nr:TetR/AcrR family transcriptional regulator [Candidatus Neomarinimicrobiota bacterium]